MPNSEITLSREDAKDFAYWTLSEVATRAPAKHQKAPFVATHIARQTYQKYLRGSDLSERIYVSVKALTRAGYAQKEALLTVAERAAKFLGKSKRGRPKVGTTKRDINSTAETIRSMVNAFARRSAYTKAAEGRWVELFVWGRKVGAIHGSEFVPDGPKNT